MFPYEVHEVDLLSQIVSAFCKYAFSAGVFAAKDAVRNIAAIIESKVSDGPLVQSSESHIGWFLPLGHPSIFMFVNLLVQFNEQVVKQIVADEEVGDDAGQGRSEE